MNISIMSLSGTHFDPTHHEYQYRELVETTSRGMYVKISNKQMADTNAAKFFASM